jgi:hypothetical protein
MLQLLRLDSGAVSCIVAAAPLRASRGVRLRVVFEERLLACHLTDHECPVLAERRVDCSLGQQSIIEDLQLLLPAWCAAWEIASARHPVVQHRARLHSVAVQKRHL